MKKKEEEFVSFKDSRNVVKEQEQDLNPLNARAMTMTAKNTREKKIKGSHSSVPYHIANLPRPQDEFNIFVNNSNQPFEHVWLQRSADGTRFIHPLEMVSVSDFIDKNVGSIEPVKPLPMENTPFKLVEEVKELKQLAAKLHSVNEFAVDLEHNQYRSFQGLTCLMQISTRIEDYVVDTLKLRVHIGPYLREVFKDPSKKKVMHGADRDIMWLQRDFGIYICNLFDTQQASRVLDLERNTLEHLLLYFCGVSVNKAYQNADWRQRPLLEDMLKYAREDTHYLLYIYDLMRRRLLSSPMGSIGGSDLLLEVYRRSYDVCMQLYEKELLTNSSYLYIYGLQEADFNSQQLSIVAGLCEWRDTVARAEDESTGYILPNKTLLEIARQMPLTVNKLQRLVKSKHPYVEVNLGSIVGIITSSIQNAAAFESAAHLLKERHQETVTEQNIEVASTVSSQQERIDDAEVINRMNEHTIKCLSNSIHVKEEYPKLERETVKCSRTPRSWLETVKCSRTQGSSFQSLGKVGEIKNEQDGHTLGFPKKSFSNLEQKGVTYIDKAHPDSAKFSGTAKEVLDKPSNGFGLGKAASKSKFDTHPKVTEQNIEVASTVSSTDKANSDSARPFSGATEEVLNNPNIEFGFGDSTSKSMFDTNSKGRVEHIKSSDVFPFQSVISNNEQPKPLTIRNKWEIPSPKNPIAMLAGITQLKKMASLGRYLADQESLHNFPTSVENGFEHGDNADTEGSKLDAVVETISLSNLSSKFQKCFQLKRKKEDTRQIERAQEPDCGLQLRAFDYSAAMKQMRLKQGQEENMLTEGDEGFKSLLNSREEHNHSIIRRFRKDEVTKDFQQAKQYQALLHTR